MNQIQYCGLANMWRHCTKFSGHGELATGSVPLLLSLVSQTCFTNACLISRNTSRGTLVLRKGEGEKIHRIYKRETRHKRLW